MDTTLIVVVLGVIIGMLVLMFHYAGFFHQDRRSVQKINAKETTERTTPSPRITRRFELWMPWIK